MPPLTGTRNRSELGDKRYIRHVTPAHLAKDLSPATRPITSQMECLSTEWNFLHTTSELANDDEMRLGNRANAHRLELVTCIMLRIRIATIPSNRFVVSETCAFRVHYIPVNYLTSCRIQCIRTSNHLRIHQHTLCPRSSLILLLVSYKSVGVHFSILSFLGIHLPILLYAFSFVISQSLSIEL